MVVSQLREILSKLDDDTEVLCAGAEIEIIVDYGDAIVIDDDSSAHDVGPLECGEVLWEMESAESLR